MKDTCYNARTGSRWTRFVFQTIVTLLLASLIGSVPAASYSVVTSIADDGPGSLRQAILTANLSPSGNLIVFNLPPGQKTIVPLSPLPDITQPVTIDAFDGITYTPATLPTVEIDGMLAGPFANGLTINSPGSVTVRGLAIYRFATGAGIALNDSHVGYPHRGIIEGCHLGTDASGKTAGLGNGTGLLFNSSSSYLVGGNDVHNVISGNLVEGVGIYGSSLDVSLGSNFIGVTRDGWPLPNGSDGVRTSTSGGLIYVFWNVIAYNGGAGVFVSGEGTVDLGLSYNSIYENVRLGIDLAPEGISNPNDFSDADTGPNQLQNYPILGSVGGQGGVESGPNGTSIEVFLNSKPLEQFIICYYWSPSCDPSGFGEGRHYLGRDYKHTDAAGNLSFTAHTGVVPVGAVVTAIAMSITGRGTSEFSPCVTVAAEGNGTSGQGVIQHAGLPHQGDGPSAPAPLPCSEGFSPANPCLLTIPAGADVQSASVRIGLGRVSGWQGDLQEVVLRDFGDSFKLELEDGTEDGTEATPPTPPSNEIFEAAKDYVIEANIPEPSLFIRALTNGSMSLQFTLVDSQDNEVYKSVAQPDALHLTLGSSNDVVDISQAGYLQLPNGERAFRIELRNPLLLAVPGVSGRFATHAIIVVFRKLNPATGQSLPPPATITSARPTYRRESPTAGAPHFFRIGEELLQQFGQLHGSLNNTVLAGWQWPQGGTSAPPRSTIYAGFPRDASGALAEGGVMLRLDQARYISVDLDWDLASSATPLFAAASWASGPLGSGQPCIRLDFKDAIHPSSDEVVFLRTERDWSLGLKFGASGTASNRYEMYRFGSLVGSLDVSTDMVARASSAPNRVAYSTSVSPTGAQGFLFKWREAATFSFPGTRGLPGVPGGAFFEADELRIIPLNPTNPLRSFTRLDISGAGLPWLEITSEDRRSSRVGRVIVQKVRDGVELSAPTEPGRPYQLEFTPSLNAREWQIIDSFIGDGSVRRWQPPGPPSIPPGPPIIPGFYRLGGF